MLQGIAFDLEGTVIDVEYAHHQAHIRTAREVGLELTIDTALGTIPHFIGGPDERIAEEIWTLSDKRKTPSEILERDMHHYEVLLADMSIEPREGFLDFLHTITALGIKSAIGSLTPSIQANFLLARSGIGKLFSESVVLRHHVMNVKPAPDVFLKTAALMHISPSDQLVFEDSPRGITAARNAGSRAIGMPVYWRKETVDTLLGSGAISVFRHWSEVDINSFRA